MLDIIRDFVEGKLDAASFFHTLYFSKELEAVCTAETELPSWANAATLYEYLISGDGSNAFLWNAKELLGKYLKKRNVTFQPDQREELEYSIVRDALPDWLDLPCEYFDEILKDDTLSRTEKISAIKTRIKREFQFLHKPPDWLQNPDWPFSKDRPLFFVGELELEKEPGRARIYVFLCRESNTYTIVNQAD